MQGQDVRKPRSQNLNPNASKSRFFRSGDEKDLDDFVKRVTLAKFPRLQRTRKKFFDYFLRILDKWFVLRDFWRTKTYSVMIGEFVFKIRRGTSDLFVVHEIFRKQTYGPPPTGTVVDLGANIGVYSVFAARSASRVVAVEPVHENFAMLRANLQDNKIDNVRSFQLAIGERNDNVRIYIHQINNGMSSLYMDSNASEFEDVELVTFSRLLDIARIQHINVLKCDVEGAEFDIFRESLYEISDRIDEIVMEVHFGTRSPEEIQKFFANFLRNGFSLEFVTVKFLFATGTGIIRIAKWS
jgi:FkbM family methyltransferase